MAEYDDLYADADIPITVSEEPMILSEAEIAEFESMPVDEFKDWYALQTPEKQAAVDELLWGQDDTELLEEQLAYGQELRGAEMPGGRTTRNNIFTAANPLEFGAPIIDRVEGYGRVNDAEEEWERILKQRAEAAELGGRRYF